MATRSRPLIREVRRSMHDNPTVLTYHSYPLSPQQLMRQQDDGFAQTEYRGGADQYSFSSPPRAVAAGHNQSHYEPSTRSRRPVPEHRLAGYMQAPTSYSYENVSQAEQRSFSGQGPEEVGGLRSVRGATNACRTTIHTTQGKAMLLLKLVKL